MENGKILTTIMLILALGAGVGCSSKKNHGDAETPLPTEPTPIDPPTPLPTPGGSGGGGGQQSDTNTVTFVPVSYETFNTYVMVRPLNNPSDFKITVDLQDDGNNKFHGSVRIGYTDNGQRYEGVFSSGSGDNPYLKYADGNGLKEYHYNYWFHHGGKTVFNGYFQDQYGSIVLVIEEVGGGGNQGDGQGGSYVSGSVWFMNFPFVQAPQGPMRKCWFITDGPYNCRTAGVSQKNNLFPGIIMDRSPSVYYHKLGTFSGLSLGRSFK